MTTDNKKMLALFQSLNKHLDYSTCVDGWGRRVFEHSHIQIAWEYFQKGFTAGTMAAEGQKTSAVKEALQKALEMLP